MPNGSVCSSDAPFCQYSVEVFVWMNSGSPGAPVTTPYGSQFSTAS